MESGNKSISRSMQNQILAERERSIELEKRLKGALKKHGFMESAVRALRAALRDSYEAQMLLDLEFCAANDVEGLLWKGCFYRPIEEFRTRIRAAEKAGGAQGRDALAKVVPPFLRFLEEAGAFYQALIMRLQARYGDVGINMELPRRMAASRPTQATSSGTVTSEAAAQTSSAPRDPRPCVHRCLIYLGDLARYQAQAAQKATPASMPSAGAAPSMLLGRPDWQRALLCYKSAARVLPTSGNPYNQLAVMAYLSGDELRAAYYYARALCARCPFSTARENLLLMCESNRVRYAKLAGRCTESPPAISNTNGHAPAATGATSALELVVELSTRYVRLVGMLFDRINLEAWPSVFDAAFASLSAFLAHPGAGEILQRQPRGDSLPVHLAVLAMFTLHNVDGHRAASQQQQVQQQEQPEQQLPHHPQGLGGHGSSESVQRSALRCRALCLLFRCGEVLFGAAASWRLNAPGTGSLMAGAHVLLEWLGAHSWYTTVDLSAGVSAEEVQQRSSCWHAAMRLVPHLQVVAFPAVSPGSLGCVHPMAAPVLPLGRAGSGSLEGGGLLEGGALPEELELLGFEPLREALCSQVLDTRRAPDDEAATRGMRALGAVRVAAQALQLQLQQGRPLVEVGAASLRGLSAPSPADMASLMAAEEKLVALALGPGIQQEPSPGALQSNSPPSRGGNSALGGQFSAHDRTAPPGSTAGNCSAAASGSHGGRDFEVNAEEAEVIVFQPRASRLASPEVSVQAKGMVTPHEVLAAGSTGAASTGKDHVPLGRSHGNSPRQQVGPAPMPLDDTECFATPAHGAVRAQTMDGQLAGAGSSPLPNNLGAGCANTPSGMASQLPPASGLLHQVNPLPQPRTGLLQGFGGTALDMQQQQRTSTMLLSRLQQKPPISLAVATSLPHQAAGLPLPWSPKNVHDDSVDAKGSLLGGPLNLSSVPGASMSALRPAAVAVDPSTALVLGAGGGVQQPGSNVMALHHPIPASTVLVASDGAVGVLGGHVQPATSLDELEQTALAAVGNVLSPGQECLLDENMGLGAVAKPWDAMLVRAGAWAHHPVEPQVGDSRGACGSISFPCPTADPLHALLVPQLDQQQCQQAAGHYDMFGGVALFEARTGGGHGQQPERQATAAAAPATHHASRGMSEDGTGSPISQSGGTLSMLEYLAAEQRRLDHAGMRRGVVLPPALDRGTHGTPTSVNPAQQLQTVGQGLVDDACLFGRPGTPLALAAGHTENTSSQQQGFLRLSDSFQVQDVLLPPANTAATSNPFIGRP